MKKPFRRRKQYPRDQRVAEVLKCYTSDGKKRLEIIFIIWIKKLAMTRTQVSVTKKLYVMTSAGHKTADQSWS